MNKQNTTLDLVKIRCKSLKFQKNQFILFGAVFALVFLMNIVIGVLLSVLEWDMSLQEINSLLIILNSVFIGIYFLVNNIWLFRGEIDDHLIHNEQHYGYQTRAIFISRLAESLFWFASFMVLLTVINVIFISAFNGFDKALFYQGYLISLGWYALVGIIITSITILFASFLKIIWTSLIGVFFLMFIIVFAFVGQILVNAQSTFNENFPNVRDDYQQIYEYQQASKVIAGFKENDNLGIVKNWDSFKRIEQDADDVLDYFIYGWNEKWAEANDPNSSIHNFYTFFDEFFKKNSDAFKKFKYEQIDGYTVKIGSDQYGNSYTHEPVNAILNKMIEYNLGKYDKLIKNYAELFKDNQSAMINHEVVPLNLRRNKWTSNESANQQPRIDANSSINGWNGDGGVSGGTVIYPYAELFANAMSINVPPAKIMFYKLFFNNIQITQQTVEEQQKFFFDKDFYNFPKIAKKMGKWASYNPLIQLDLMLQGVNYRDTLKYNSLGGNSMIGSVPIMTINKLPADSNYESWEGIETHRVVGTEGLYFGYLVLNGLLIFASYWIFRKKIKQ